MFVSHFGWYLSDCLCPDPIDFPHPFNLLYPTNPRYSTIVACVCERWRRRASPVNRSETRAQNDGKERPRGISYNKFLCTFASIQERERAPSFPTQRHDEDVAKEGLRKERPTCVVASVSLASPWLNVKESEIMTGRGRSRTSLRLLGLHVASMSALKPESTTPSSDLNTT